MFGIRLRVWGEYACYTRCELKVERVSYDSITPSAARAILESIYWKPSIRWIIDKITVVKPIQFTNFRRNELSNKISTRNIVMAMKGEKQLFTLIEEDRQQRASTILKNVEYIISAHFHILSKEELQQKGLDPNNFPTEENNEGKHLAIFQRRAEQGQCYKRPYLGCREFPAHFELMDEKTVVHPQGGSKDLGWMLYDIDFQNDKTPMFFHAVMKDGEITIPDPESEEVKR